MPLKCHTYLIVTSIACAVIAQEAADSSFSAKLPPQLLSIIPTCAQNCTANAVARDFALVACSLDDLACLCSSYGSDGYTLGERAFGCLYADTCTTADRANSTLVYDICSNVNGSALPTHQTVIVTATADPVSTSPSTSTSTRRSTTFASIAMSPASSTQQTSAQTTTSDDPAASSSVPALSIVQTAVPTPLSEAQVAGIAIASIALVVLTVGMTGCFLFFRKRKQLLQRQKTKEKFYHHHQSSGTRQDLLHYPIDPRGGTGGVGIQPLPRSPTEVTPPPPVYERRWPRYYGISPNTHDIGIARTVDVPIVMPATSLQDSGAASKSQTNGLEPPAVPPKAAERDLYHAHVSHHRHKHESPEDPFRTPERVRTRVMDANSSHSRKASPASYQYTSETPAGCQMDRRAPTLHINIPSSGFNALSPKAFQSPRRIPSRPERPSRMVIPPEIRDMINRSREPDPHNNAQSIRLTMSTHIPSNDDYLQRPPLEVLRQQRAGPLAKLGEAREARVARRAQQITGSELSSNVPSSEVLPAGAMRDELQVSPRDDHVKSFQAITRGSKASLTSFESTYSTDCSDDDQNDFEVEKMMTGASPVEQSPISNLRYPSIPRSVSPPSVPYSTTAPQLLFTLDELSPIGRDQDSGKTIENQLWRTQPSPIGTVPTYRAFQPGRRTSFTSRHVPLRLEMPPPQFGHLATTPENQTVTTTQRNHASIVYHMPQLTPTRKGDDLYLSVS